MDYRRVIRAIHWAATTKVTPAPLATARGLASTYEGGADVQSVRDSSRPHDLYRFYDADDRLLYIGISLNAAQRASSHKRDKPWWNEVAWIHVDHLGLVTRHRAEQIERHAIQVEQPAYNITHNGLRPITPPSRQHEPLGEVGEGVYEAARHLLTSSTTFSPFTLEAIIDAVRDGVREAVSDHVEVIVQAVRE